MYIPCYLLSHNQPLRFINIEYEDSKKKNFFLFCINLYNDDAWTNLNFKIKSLAFLLSNSTFFFILTSLEDKFSSNFLINLLLGIFIKVFYIQNISLKLSWTSLSKIFPCQADGTLILRSYYYSLFLLFYHVKISFLIETRNLLRFIYLILFFFLLLL